MDWQEMQKKFEDDLLPYVVAEKDKWKEWSCKIPFITFPAEWKIKIIPPFGGAIARFRAWVPGMKEGDSVSVYLDCYDRLGLYGAPYWEVYPHQGDCGCCDMDDTVELLRMIGDRSDG